MLVKKKLIALILGICIIGGAIVLIAKPKENPEVKREKEHIVVVDDITISIDGGGEAKLDGTDHNFDITGIVDEIYIKKGEKIKKGSKIAKLSSKEINSEIDELKIEQDAKVESLKGLKEQKKNSPQDSTLNGQIKIAQGELDKLNKKIKSLKSNLDKLYIYAKKDGIVLDIGYELGEQTAQSKPIAVIGDEKNVHIDVLLSQTDIINIHEGQDVNVTFETYSDIELKGKVEEKNYISSGQGEDVDYKVRAKLDVNDLEIYQGMTAEVKFIIKSKEDVLQISNKAITMENNKSIVKVKDNDEVKEIEVKTGFSDGNVTEIIEGLQEGQIVVEER
ncbi:MAG: efflux RND transporter periplasmic adaptor subunit [Peptostreptococcaceae bacterium]